MKKTPKHKHGYWTKERCTQKAALYSNTTEFRKSSPYVYQLVKEMGWFEEICPHMKRLFAPKGYWNSKDNCLKEACKHKTRTSFARNAPTAYENCLKNGWDEAFAHMKQILDYSITYEQCAAIAIKCKSQAQMQREYPKYYSYACRHHIMQKIFTHLPKIKPVNKGTSYRGCRKM